MQRAANGLSQTLTLQCFLSFIDPKASKPDLSGDLIKAGYYRRTMELKSLPDSVMVTLREQVMGHGKYSSIAQETGLHAAEVAWLAKHVIRPEARRRQEMKDHALRNIRDAKEGRESECEEQNEIKSWRQNYKQRDRWLDYEEWRRGRELQEGRLSARELHNPGSKASRKARLDVGSLDFSWHWMTTDSPHTKLDSDEQDLLKWFRETGERTFKWRRDSRRENAKRKLRERALGSGNPLGRRTGTTSGLVPASPMARDTQSTLDGAFQTANAN
jgi:hypothetical protein